MSTTYEDYRRALTQLKDLPARTAADLEKAKQAHAKANALADKAFAAAETAAADSLKAIENQLTAARTVLELIGKSNLVPPHIHPSGGVGSATRHDVANAQQALATAVNQLRQAVQAENEWLVREAVVRERLAREAAERAASAASRRKKLIQFGTALALALALAVIIMVLVVAF